MLRSSILSILCLLAVLASIPGVSGALVVTVADANGVPLENATVRIPQAGLKLTDENGNARFDDLLAQRHNAIVSTHGYEQKRKAFEIAENETKRIAFQLNKTDDQAPAKLGMDF